LKQPRRRWMRAVRVALILAVALLMVCPVLAQEKKKERKRGPGAFDPIQMMLQGLTLTDEQKAKVEDVKKEFAPKLAEAAKNADVLTPDQKKARDEATKKARDEGKSRREVAAAAADAVKLTDEQKTKRDEARKAMRAVGEQYRAKVIEILTPEQKAEVEKRMAEFKKRAASKKNRGQ
jgi:Spy/CpxP family protein refolding chaperone